ncbi:hypothetical protein [Nocardiopsis synnemataformans]|uniref:hypothetical protein n=1 Tax=Nocardiopsis synnemataformans TaxID=61305 RepID=UPI003EB6BD9C
MIKDEKDRKAPVAECPVCGRLLRVKPDGGLYGHGNRDWPAWKACVRFQYAGATDGWAAREDGALVAPAGVAEQVWDVRAAVEQWPGAKGLSQMVLSKLIGVLTARWDALNRELIGLRAQRDVVRDQEAVQAVVLSAVVGLVGEEQAPVVAAAAAKAVADLMEGSDGQR